MIQQSNARLRILIALCNWLVFILAVFIVAACTTTSSTDVSSLATITQDDPKPTSTPTPHLPAQPEPNFAFSFSFGTCSTDILDTFTHTFTRDLITDVMTIPFTLTDAQMSAIYQEMVEIDFFDYPERFQVLVADDETATIVTPATTYRLVVRNGAFTKTVAWKDEILKPTSPEADRLRGLIQTILQIVQAAPDIQQLPKPAIGCM